MLQIKEKFQTEICKAREDLNNNIDEANMKKALEDKSATKILINRLEYTNQLYSVCLEEAQSNEKNLT